MPKKLSTNTKILIILGAIFMIATSAILANLLSMAIYPTTQSSAEVKSNSFELHLLCVGKSQNELAAKALAPDYQKLGAGGYIWKNGDYFYIVASAYLNKNDADLVQTNLKNSDIDCEIFSVNFKGLSVCGSFSSLEKKVLQKALNISFQSYQNLFDASISLDTGVYNSSAAKIAVNAVQVAINSAITDFETLFKNSENEALQKIETMLNGLKKTSSSLASGKLANDQTYSSFIKYHYIEILDNYLSLN